MTVPQAPYHLDDYLPDLDLVLGAGEIITADLPSGDAWARLAVLAAWSLTQWSALPAMAAARSWSPGLHNRAGNGGGIAASRC